MRKFVLTVIIIITTCLTAIAQDFKTHKVKPGETIEDIAKLYLVTPYDIYALNPDAKNKLEINSVLIIPDSRVKNDPIISETKEVIGYKTHKVKRKETLYSISKLYNIEIVEIKKHNTNLYSETLQKGDKIKIPRYKTIVSQVTLSNTLKTYTVQPKEGKWRVAYKFGITVPELEALNPNIKEVLQPGDELNVPNISNNEEKIVEETYNYYTVQKSEGFMALNRKLGVSKEELENLNPELVDGGLKLGMVIKVPKDIVTTGEVIDVANTDLSNTIKNKSTKQLALLMPYRLNKIDIDSVADTKKAMKTDSRLSLSLDFHSGVLMALDSAKHLGISTNLKVIDTRDQASEITNILNRNDFSNYDAVIGPLMPANFERVASELKRDHVPVISPFASPQNLYDNVYQSVPSNELLEKAIINFVKADPNQSHVVIISDHKNRAISNKLKAEFPVARQFFSQKKKDGGDAYYLLASTLEDVFREGTNIVFLQTSNEGFASNVTSMLNGLQTEEIKIVLMTTDKNKAFEGKEISNIHLSNLNFHYPSVNKTFDATQPNNFIKNYKKEYGIEPNKYAIRGFDLTLDLLLRLASEDTLYEASNNDLETEYVENKFRYSKQLFGGYTNESVYVVMFKDLTIVEAQH